MQGSARHSTRECSDREVGDGGAACPKQPLPNDFCVLLVLPFAVPPFPEHDGRVHVGWREGVGLVKQGDYAQQDSPGTKEREVRPSQQSQAVGCCSNCGLLQKEVTQGESSQHNWGWSHPFTGLAERRHLQQARGPRGCSVSAIQLPSPAGGASPSLGPESIHFLPLAFQMRYRDPAPGGSFPASGPDALGATFGLPSSAALLGCSSSCLGRRAGPGVIQGPRTVASRDLLV